VEKVEGSARYQNFKVLRFGFSVQNSKVDSILTEKKLIGLWSYKIVPKRVEVEIMLKEN